MSGVMRFRDVLNFVPCENKKNVVLHCGVDSIARKK